MKHILTFIILCSTLTIANTQNTGNCSVCCSFMDSGYTDCVDFENFNIGNLVPQASPQFTLFESNSNNAIVTSFPENAGNKCMYILNSGDIDYNIGRQLTEDIVARLEWKMYIPSGFGGAWGLETNNPIAYPLFIAMDKNLLGTIYRTQENQTYTKLGDFQYKAGEWTSFAIVFHPNLNNFELWVNDKIVYTVTNYMSNMVTDLNIFSDNLAMPNKFYVDDLCYRETNSNIFCTLEYSPVCVNQQTYSNGCFAELSGYSECEMVAGECTSNTNEPTVREVVFYPNPSRSGIFQTDDLDVEYTTLMDANGQSLDFQVNQGILDLSHLPKGIYILYGTKDGIAIRSKLAIIR